MPGHAVFEIKIGGEHGTVKGGKSQLVEQVELDTGEIAVGEERLGMRGDNGEVEAVEEIV